MVESWHAISAAVREAQELGMFKPLALYVGQHVVEQLVNEAYSRTDSFYKACMKVLPARILTPLSER